MLAGLLRFITAPTAFAITDNNTLIYNCLFYKNIINRIFLAAQTRINLCFGYKMQAVVIFKVKR
jgi:hypothetical protein